MTHAPDDLPAALADRYTITRVLGRGGMAHGTRPVHPLGIGHSQDWLLDIVSVYFFSFSPSRLRIFTPVAVSICSVILMIASGS